jgi:hypothetical protein
VSVLRPFAARRHFDQLGIKLAENRDEVALSGHDFADVLVGHGNFIKAGGYQGHATVMQETVYVLPVEFLVRGLAAHDAARAVRRGVQRFRIPKGPVRFTKRNAPAFAPSKGAALRLDDPAILIEELGVGQSVLRSALIIRGLEVVPPRVVEIKRIVESSNRFNDSRFAILNSFWTPKTRNRK